MIGLGVGTIFNKRVGKVSPPTPWLFPDHAWTVTGKTNEDEDRATIANITGNGNDLVLSNFAFSGNSGMVVMCTILMILLLGFTLPITVQLKEQVLPFM